MSSHEDTTVSPSEHFAEDPDDLTQKWNRVIRRRSFLKGMGVAGAAAIPGAGDFSQQAVITPAGLHPLPQKRRTSWPDLNARAQAST